MQEQERTVYVCDTEYEDEPIRIPPEREKLYPPKEYRSMRNLEFDSPFSSANEGKIFYLQGKFMEHFEDDCPYDREVNCYFPTYQKLSLPELRGYFTWRTRLRKGILEETSLSYAYLYIYELINQIGVDSKEEGFDRLVRFYESYRLLDRGIERHTPGWIVDYAIYYELSLEGIRNYLDLNFDEAVYALRRCDEVEEEALVQGLLTLGSYKLGNSKAFKRCPQELKQVLSNAYRKRNARYQRMYGVPYAEKLFGGVSHRNYIPFHSAVFFPREMRRNGDVQISPVQRCYLRDGRWTLERDYCSTQKSKALGTFLRAVDRLFREAYHISPGLKADMETREMVAEIKEALEELREAKRPKVEFDLSLLGSIRRSSETIGEKLLTEEERMLPEEEDKESTDREESSEYFAAELPLTSIEQQFLRLLLWDGDWKSYLKEQKLMPSLVVESINEALYEEFADMVLDFDGDRPLVIEDYLEDLKGFISE